MRGTGWPAPSGRARSDEHLERGSPPSAEKDQLSAQRRLVRHPRQVRRRSIVGALNRCSAARRGDCNSGAALPDVDAPGAEACFAGPCWLIGLWPALCPRHLAALGENLERLGLIRRTIPVTTRPTPMINIGQASSTDPPPQAGRTLVTAISSSAVDEVHTLCNYLDGLEKHNQDAEDS